MIIRNIIEDRVQSHRISWPMLQAPLAQEHLNNVVNQLLCFNHNPIALFGNDGLRQYWKCSKCSQITT